MAVLAAPRLELRLRADPRSRARVSSRSRASMPRTCARSTWRTRTSCGRSSGAPAASSSSSTSRRASSSTTATSSRRCWCGSCDRSPGSRAHGFAVTRLRVRPHRDAVLARLEPHRVHGLSDARPADLERPAHVRRGPAPVPPRTGPAHRPHVGEPLEAGLEDTAERFLERTIDYWRRWVKGRRVPRDYQGEVVRSALALKLHQYEDTGAPRGDDDEPPRASGIGPQLGLPLLLAPRRVLHTERARAARALGGDGALPRVPAEHLRGARGCSSPRTASTATRTRRKGARAPRGVQGRRAGAGRQPGLRARPERRLRRDGARGQPVVPRHAFHGRDPAADGGRAHAAARRPDRRAVGRAGRRAVGVPREDPPSQLLGADALGGARDERSRWRRRSAPPSSLLMHAAWSSARRSSSKRGAGATTSRRSRRSPASRSSTPRCSWPCTWATSPPTTREPHLTSTRFAKVCRWTAVSSADTRPETTSATWKRRSPSARSGSSRPLRSSGERTRRASSSTGCFARQRPRALLEDILPDTLEQSGNFPQTYSHVGLINAAFRLSRRWD